MSDRASLVAAVAASPDDDLPKLVFADWLDENGEPDRAKFIRLSVAYYREASAFPPTPDPAKRQRIEELFRTHDRDWLRPVYDPLGQPVPEFPPPGRIDPIAHLHWSVGSQGGISVMHPVGGPVHSLTFHAGLPSLLILYPHRLPPTASLAPAMAVEPLEGLNLMLPADVSVWRRLHGPHMHRVRSLTPNFNPGVAADATPADVPGDYRPLAEAICGSEHLGGLRSLHVSSAPLFDALRVSPLRRRLDTLSVFGAPAGHFLSDPGHGFDSLRRLSVGVGTAATAADELFRRGIDDSFRQQLTRLVMPTSGAHGLAWLTNGPAWGRLDTLFLTGDGVGDAGAARLAAATTLPALRELRLSRVNVGDTGAIALARAPWVAKLDALFLDFNPIGDDGAVELALALDRGLKYLSLRHTQSRIAPRTRQALSARYGPRIAFDFPPLW